VKETDMSVDVAHHLRGEGHLTDVFVSEVLKTREVRLAFRAFIEQVRLVLRDGRRLIRRLIAVCDTSRGSSSVEMTNSPAPLASVPLVVLRPTTEREQIELNDLVQSLSAEGYQVTRRGPQWVVYTEITDRRTSRRPRRNPGDVLGNAGSLLEPFRHATTEFQTRITG
jgi:hypothetical protein